MSISGEKDPVAINSIEANITFMEEIENIRLYHILAPGGMTIKVEQHGFEANETVIPSIGEKIQVSWKPEDAVLLERVV